MWYYVSLLGVHAFQYIGRLLCSRRNVFRRKFSAATHLVVHYKRKNEAVPLSPVTCITPLLAPAGLISYPWACTRQHHTVGFEVSKNHCQEASSPQLRGLLPRLSVSVTSRTCYSEFTLHLFCTLLQVLFLLTGRLHSESYGTLIDYRKILSSGITRFQNASIHVYRECTCSAVPSRRSRVGRLHFAGARQCTPHSAR